MSPSSVLRWVELWALFCAVAALGLAGFFGMMAWMSGAPLHTARRWLRWTLYPTAVWLLALALRAVTQR